MKASHFISVVPLHDSVIHDITYTPHLKQLSMRLSLFEPPPGETLPLDGLDGILMFHGVERINANVDLLSLKWQENMGEIRNSKLLSKANADDIEQIGLLISFDIYDENGISEEVLDMQIWVRNVEWQIIP